MSRLTVSGLALAISLAGCASAPPTLSQQELQSAQQNGSLEALYDQYAAKLAGQKLNTPEGQKAQQQLNELGAQLGGKLEQEIRSELNQQGTASGLVPLPVIDAQSAKLPKLQKWSPEKYSKLAAELNELKGRTQARITSQQNQLAKFTEGDEVGEIAAQHNVALRPP